MTICEINKLLQISLQLYIVIYHTNQNMFSNFTNGHKQCLYSLVASIWKCKYIEWDRLIFAICFIIVSMITWFHQIYRINCTIIWLPKWCEQIFNLNKSNNYWSILHWLMYFWSTIKLFSNLTSYSLISPRKFCISIKQRLSLNYKCKFIIRYYLVKITSKTSCYLFSLFESMKSHQLP